MADKTLGMPVTKNKLRKIAKIWEIPVKSCNVLV